jgi:hypothetical protein
MGDCKSRWGIEKGQAADSRFKPLHTLAILSLLPRILARFTRIGERFQLWKRACIIVLFGMLLMCLALCVIAVLLVGRASAQQQETDPLPFDFLLLIDHSNSMWDKGGVGSDPDLLRVEAANLFIAYLGADVARTGNRLGVIHFGGSSELVIPLTPLDSAEQRQAIRAAIANPRRMDWTDPLEALQLADETLFPYPQSQRDPARQPAVVLLTDGKPELSSNPSQEERAAYVADLRALVDRFRAHGCPIFTIALSNEATDADPEIQTVYRNLWQEIAARTPPAEYHEARTADDLPRIYHAIAAAVTTNLSGVKVGELIVETTVDGEAVETITVEPGLAQVTLVVLRDDPALEVQLLRPGGAPARPDDPDVQRTGTPGVTREEVWAISRPRPGRWTLELRGHHGVTVWQDTIPEGETQSPTYTIEMTPPLNYVLTGRPADIGGISLVETPAHEPVIDPDLEIIAEVYRAGFAEATFLARDDGKGCDAQANDGRYCAVLSDPPPGACTLVVRALLDGTEVARREIAFEARPAPPEATAPPPVSSLAAAAPGPSSSKGPEIRFSSKDGRFDPAHSGKSRVSSSRWTFPLAGLVGLTVVGSVGGIWLWQRRGRVTLDGSLRLLAAPSGELAGTVLDIPSLPSVVLGGMGRHALPLPGVSHRATLRASRTPEGEVETWVTPLTHVTHGESDAILLNDHPLETARRLHDGDVLALGDYRLRYESLYQASARRARHRPRPKANWTRGVK